MQISFLSLFLCTAARASFVGINLGNCLEAPTEGAWAPVAQDYYFDDYVAEGFTRVRVPVRWDEHMGTTPPYAIDATFMARVHEVVGWGLSRNLTVVVNSHHDDWIDSEANFSAQLPRFLALWRQVADSFSTAPPSLLFEVINEPVSLTLAQLNQLYSGVVPLMRASNPTRPIYLGGLSWMSPYWIAKNPDGVVFPPLPSGAPDPSLRLEVHSYDPYAFCLQDPPTASTWGSPSDIATVTTMYTDLAAWAANHSNRVVYMGEAGCQVKAPSRQDRLLWYKTVGAASKAVEGITIWDDYGSYKVYDRVARTWDKEVLQALFGN